MRKLLLIIPISYLTVYWATIVACGFVEGYVSEKTEEKYLRNLDKFQPIDNDQLYCGMDYSDSLTFVATSYLHQIDPFHKWYIDKVGTIKPWSRLSKALDSMAATYGSKYE